jgi:hypothetical protein
MSAKPGKRAARREAATQTAPGGNRVPGGQTAAPGPAPAAAPAWIDSTDPRRRRIGRLVLAGVWVYAAALWLLALDQTFDWGMF